MHKIVMSRITFSNVHYLTFIHIKKELPCVRPYLETISFCNLTWLNETSYNLVSSANILHQPDNPSGRSLMKIVNNSGPRMLPCGIPLNTFALEEYSLPTHTT